MQRGSSGLLPQPGGFAGFVFLVVPVDLDARYQTVLVKCPNGPGDDVQLDPAGRPSGGDELSAQDRPACDDNGLKCFEHLLLKRIWLHPTSQALGTPVRGLIPWRNEHDVAMDQGEGTVEVLAATANGFQPATCGLHVLLRHRLLRKAGGFEGFLSCPVLAAPRNLPVSERVEGGVGQIRLDATQLGAAADSGDGDDVVLARVDQLDRLAHEVVEGVLPVLHVGAHGVLAVDRAGVIGCALCRPVVDVVRQVPGPGIQVAALEGLSRIADGLYVLLRHRTRSISRGIRGERPLPPSSLRGSRRACAQGLVTGPLAHRRCPDQRKVKRFKKTGVLPVPLQSGRALTTYRKWKRPAHQGVTRAASGASREAGMPIESPLWTRR